MEKKVDRRASPGRFLRLLSPALAGLFIWSAGCGRSGYKAVEFGEIHGEAPRDWEFLPGADGQSLVMSPDTVNEVGAFLAAFPEEVKDKAELLSLMEYSRRVYVRDSRFSQEDLKKIEVAGSEGYLVSETRTSSAPIQHRKSSLPPVPVKYREIELHFSSGGKGYCVAYGAPEGLDGKYQAVFEHFVATLRIVK